jgi:hypothetical protein
MSKQEMRKRLASLSFSEKIQILEKLRDRSLAFAASGPRKKLTAGDRKNADKAQEEVGG